MRLLENQITCVFDSNQTGAISQKIFRDLTARLLGRDGLAALILSGDLHQLVKFAQAAA